MPFQGNIGVSAVKVKNIIFKQLVLCNLKITNTLKMKSVKSQENKKRDA
jgi:hypothetical protein